MARCQKLLSINTTDNAIRNKMIVFYSISLVLLTIRTFDYVIYSSPWPMLTKFLFILEVVLMVYNVVAIAMHAGSKEINMLKSVCYSFSWAGIDIWQCMPAGQFKASSSTSKATQCAIEWSCFYFASLAYSQLVYFTLSIIIGPWSICYSIFSCRW